MTELLFAMTIVLAPENGYLGQLPPSTEICGFTYAPSTVFSPGTRLNILPFVEQYGPGSFIPDGSGSYCGPCMVKSITMEDTGITYIHCEIK